MTSSTEPTLVIVGSTMVDMIAYVDRVPERGQTILGNSFAIGFGGKGANQAVMASRFGCRVYMVNTLGDDVFAESYLKNFADQGINTDFVARTSGPSGVAPIWVESDGANRIIIVPGANNAMTPEQGVTAIQSIDDISVVIGQLEIPQAVTAAAFEAARARGAVTILNPAPWAELSPELLAASDWIVPNETEFAALVGSDPSLQITDAMIVEQAKALQKNLLVTLGSAGAAYASPGGDVLRVAAPKVDAIDSTGAGDSFVGSFAFGIGSGLSIAKAMQLGCACASNSVTKLGTQSSYPDASFLTPLVASLSVE